MRTPKIRGLVTGGRRVCLFVSFAMIQLVAAEIYDGPYVTIKHPDTYESLIVEIGDEGLRKAVTTVAPNGEIKVPAVDGRPAFVVPLRAKFDPESDVRNIPPETPVFVMADSHGEYEICTELLMRHGIIDPQMKWSFGHGHLVVLGDVFDRGPRQLEILWLLFKLEREANEAGGQVHLVLGNHETLVLTGNLAYLHPRYIQSAGILGVDGYEKLFGTDTVLGQWLRAKATVIKLGQTLYLHGGMSVGTVDTRLTLGQINSTVRDWLNDPRSNQDSRMAFITGRSGPLWYRGYFPEHSRDSKSANEVVLVMEHYGVERIAVGHTVVRTIQPLHGGAVIGVQVYPKKDKGTGKMNMEGVYIDEQGVWHRAKIDGSREILQDDAGSSIKNGVPRPATTTPNRQDASTPVQKADSGKTAEIMNAA